MLARQDDDPHFDAHVAEINEMLGKIIKHSRTLQHMNLTGTGLVDEVIYEMGNNLRKARSILVLHLSANPGLSQENMEYLSQRIRCRQNEDIERFTRIQSTVKRVMKETGAGTNIIDGIKHKVERD